MAIDAEGVIGDLDKEEEVLERKDEPRGGGGRAFGLGRDEERVGMRGGGPAATMDTGEVMSDDMGDVGGNDNAWCWGSVTRPEIRSDLSKV